MSQVKAVCISSRKGEAKKAVESIELKADFGAVDDAHAGAETHRQVSLLDEKTQSTWRLESFGTCSSAVSRM